MADDSRPESSLGEGEGGNRLGRLPLWLRRRRRFACVNCGYEGSARITGVGPLLWVVLLAMAWNAWMFHHAGMEPEALFACLVALVGAWGTFKMPRWIRCPACGWKHPLDGRDAP